MKQKLSEGQRRILRGLLDAFPNLETIEDATEPITVTVKECDRKNAKPWDHDKCAMARACMREKHVDGAYIQISKAYLVKGTNATRYEVPATVAREIVSFDRHSDFAIGRYGLSPVSKSNRLGKEQGSKKKWTKSPTKKKPLVVHQTASVRS